MGHKSSSVNQLSRGLDNRHIQLIVLGGAVGAGLFLQTQSSITLAGPSVLLGFCITGFIAFLIMRQLAEMTVDEPVAGSFSYFAYKYWGGFAGFIAGWNYWLLYVLLAMTELVAVAEYSPHLWPNLPTWIPVLLSFVLINFINLIAVRFYGEAEFWFSLIKVIAIIAMILYGSYLLFFPIPDSGSSISNLWGHNGFMPHGWSGLIMALAAIMFSFGGLELVGITAAEAKEPEKTIPKATNQLIVRILIFYIGVVGILLCLQPWDAMKDLSPFETVFRNLNKNAVVTIMYSIALLAALSAYNSCLYCNSRMLYGLSLQGNAPKSFQSISRRGIPIIAIAISGIATVIILVLHNVLPDNIFSIMASLVTTTLVINWILITLTHIMFKRAKNKQGLQTKFRALLYPAGNILCLIFLASILVIMWIGSFKLSVGMIPVWLFILTIGYSIKNHLKKK